MNKPIRIIIVDDHPLIKEGVKQILSFYEDMLIVGEGNNGQEALALAERIDCGIMLLDINMPVLNGLEAAKQLKERHPKLPILLLTVENDHHTLREAIGLHINGYILKESAGTTLIDAIRKIHSGEHYIDPALSKQVMGLIQEASTQADTSQAVPSLEALSDREKQILYYISEGLTNKQIGLKLFLSEKTIRNCITVLFKKIEVKDRTQAALFARQYHNDLFLTIS